MARINIYDEAGTMVGWFDPAKCESWEQATGWDGDGHVELATGSKEVDARLYLTTGNRWVLGNYALPRFAGGVDTFRFISAEDAYQWLARNGCPPGQIQALIARTQEMHEAERTPTVSYELQMPEGLLRRIEEAATQAGVSQAEWLRQAAIAALPRD